MGQALSLKYFYKNTDFSSSCMEYPSIMAWYFNIIKSIEETKNNYANKMPNHMYLEK